MGLAYGTAIGRNLDLVAARADALKRTGDGFKYLWRIEAVRYSMCQLDQYRNEILGVSATQLEMFAISVKKWTPTGARLHTGQHVDLRANRKQYASRSPEQALEQFRRRRKAQIRILEGQLSRARQELSLTSPVRIITCAKPTTPDAHPLLRSPYSSGPPPRACAYVTPE